MAKLWKLPMLFVCENNRVAMGTVVERSSQNTDFFARGDQIPGFRVDGNDFLAVREAFKWAKNWAIENGPLMIECDTYRYHGHSMSDPGDTYRTRDEVLKVREERDCIKHVKELLLKNNFATEQELEAIVDKVKDDIEAAY